MSQFRPHDAPGAKSAPDTAVVKETSSDMQGRYTFSIRKKLMLSVGVLLASISLFIFLFFPSRLEQQALESMATKAASLAEMMAYTIGPALDFEDMGTLEENLGAVQQLDNFVYANVVKADGTPVFNVVREAEGVLPARYLLSDDGVSPDGQTYHVNRPIGVQGRQLGILYLGFSLATVEQATARSQTIVAIVSLLIFVLGLGIMLTVSIVMTRPLENIVRAASSIAEGDLAQRATVQSSDEVGELAWSFNQMVDSLETTYTALQTSEERFRAVIEHITDAIVLVDAEGRMRYLSPSAKDVMGYGQDELENHRFLTYVHPEDQERMQEILDEAASRENFRMDADIRWRHRKGSWVYLSYRGKNLLQHPGIEAILISARDVTQERQTRTMLIEAKEQAEESVRLKDNFLANMSHEIRTPLSGILGFAQILMEEVSADQLEWVELITQSGNRLMHTLNSVLDLAQLQARSLHLECAPVDLINETQDATRLLTPIIPDNVELHVNVPDDAVFAHLDSGAYQRILTNLIGNAAKFTAQGRIEVEVEPKDETVHVHVRDTGIGMTGDFLKRLFDAFQQESTGVSRSHEGNGLGLSITKHLVDLMSGTIAVQSVKGLGSVFTVSFPRIAAPAPRKSLTKPVVEPLRLAPGSTRPRLLIVEDNPETLRLYERALEKTYDLVLVATAEAAYQALEKNGFDAVILDINLGGGDNGIDILKHIRQQPQMADVPTLAVTANAMPGDAARYQNAGFDDYLSKPFAIETLRSTLARRLDDTSQAA